MKRYQVAILEDDSKHAETLSKYLSRFASENSFDVDITHFFSAVEAIETFKGQYDLLFLDIQMPGMSGMDFAKEIRQKDPFVMIIFVTSLSQFALEGYEVQATDYLLKPLSYPEFSIKMKRAFHKLPEKEESVIRFNGQNGIFVIPVRDVLYCETEGHSVIYHTASEDYRKRQPMRETERELQEFSFLRINSCYLVATKEIVGMENHFLILRNGERLLVSRPRLQAVTAFLKNEGKDA